MPASHKPPTAISDPTPYLTEEVLFSQSVGHRIGNPQFRLFTFEFHTDIKSTLERGCMCEKSVSKETSQDPNRFFSGLHIEEQNSNENEQT